MELYRNFFTFQFIFLTFCLTVSNAHITRRQANQDFFAFRVETLNVASYSESGNLSVKANTLFKLRLFANKKIDKNGQIKFTTVNKRAGEGCDDVVTSYVYTFQSVEENTALLEVKFDEKDAEESSDFKICYKESEQAKWIHQGTSFLKTITPVSSNKTIEQIIIIVQSLLIPLCLILSGLLSALALNLLSLTKSELRMLKNQGTSEEKKYSKVVTPLRRRGNVLFCSLLLMNTLVNVLISILFHNLISYWSILAATLLIVFLGEIIPQTICSRFGLLFGNTLAWLTNIIVVITFPFSFPVSKLLDWMLNDEVPMVYNRDRFQELMTKNQGLAGSNSQKNKSSTNGLTKESLKALMVTNKRVGDIMLSLEDTFMQEYEDVLDEETVSNIIRTGFTRIPIFKQTRSNIVALLHLNDLKVLDPSDMLSVKTVCMFHNRPINFVFEDTKLDVIMEEFKKGRSHMAMVQRVNSEGPNDPYYETVGMVTLEDVISEVFKPDHDPSSKDTKSQHDVRMSAPCGQELVDSVRLGLFKRPSDRQGDHNGISNNQLHVIRSFLTQFPPFHEDVLTQKDLEKLIRQGQVISCSKNLDGEQNESQTEKNTKKIFKDLDHVIVEKNKSMRSFVLVLEGGVVIVVGAEDFVFPGKPFDHFGLASLTRDSATSVPFVRPSPMKGDQACDYVPDYTVRPDPHTGVTYLVIDQPEYHAALQASLLKRINDNPDKVDHKGFFASQGNVVSEADFVSTASITQHQQLEQQMQQQQRDLEQQLQHQQQLQEQHLHDQQLHEQQSPFQRHVFVNPSYNKRNQSTTQDENILEKEVGYCEEFNNDVNEYKKGLIAHDREGDEEGAIGGVVT